MSAISNEKVHDHNEQKYCRFQRSGIKYIDYKDPEFFVKIGERSR